MSKELRYQENLYGHMDRDLKDFELDKAKEHLDYFFNNRYIDKKYRLTIILEEWNDRENY